MLSSSTSLTAADALVYRVAGISCSHCAIAVTEEVAQVSGVASVDVDLDAKLVRVRGADVDAGAVVVAIDEAGYDAVAA
jgi:copper chaperone